jgi:hypothetical protein
MTTHGLSCVSGVGNPAFTVMAGLVPPIYAPLLKRRWPGRALRLRESNGIRQPTIPHMARHIHPDVALKVGG